MPTSASRRIRLDAVSALILLAWAVVVLPRLVLSLTAAKFRVGVAESAPSSTAARLATYLLTALFLGSCLLVVGRRLRALPAERGGTLLLLLAPWLYLAARDLYADTPPRPSTLLYPLAVLAIWALRPELDRLALLGWLVGLTAVLSIVLAVVLPAKGLLAAAGGDLIAPEKRLLPVGILIGPFSDGNNLGQFLALGLPAVGLVRHRGARLGLGAVTVFAIVFTSSRSSLAAAGAAVLATALLGRLPRAGRMPLAGALLAAAAAVVPLLPLSRPAAAAFDNRGFIWRVSLREWATDPVYGLGSHYYSAIGRFANTLGSNAFHGHNQFVHALITGGLLYLASIAALAATLVVAAVRWAGRSRLFPTAYLVAWFVSCSLEVSFGPVDRDFLLAVTAVPMAVLAFAPGLPRPPVGRPHATEPDRADPPPPRPPDRPAARAAAREQG